MSNRPLEEKKIEINMFFQKPVMLKQLEMALPAVGITKERMVRALFTAITQTPLLAECSPMSLFTALIQSATVGLVPNTPLGHAFLIPFYNTDKKVRECQFQMGYKGYIELANRSGFMGCWISRIVNENDKFDYEHGTNEYIKHKPNDDNPGEMTFVYSVFKYPNGMSSIEIMTKKKVDAIRARSKAPNSPAWQNDYESMARAKVMKRHSNHLPLSIEIATAATLDGKNDAGVLDLAGIIDIEPEQAAAEPEKKKSGLEVLAEASGGNGGNGSSAH